MRIVSLVLFIVGLINQADGQGLYINEVMASNTNTIRDESGAFEDWIEIYNEDTVGWFLNGFFIADNTNASLSYRFPNGVDSLLWVPPHGFLVLWASSDTSKGVNHLPFSLSASGDALVLSNPDSLLLDAAVFGPQQTNSSYGRGQDGGGTWGFFGIPTPGNSNNNTPMYNGFMSPPSFSMGSGFYNHAISLSLTHPDPDAVILYSLDGSEPHETGLQGQPYPFKNNFPLRQNDSIFPLAYDTLQAFTFNQPITLSNKTLDSNRIASRSTTFDTLPFYAPDSLVTKANIVKAVAVKPGFLPSQSTTQTYFIGSDFGNRYTFPVVSIVADKRHLFDYNDGFITAGADYEEWRVQNTDLSEGWVPANWQREGLEYPATFEYFDKGKNLVVSQNLGIRVHGGWSRARRKKSFRLYPRNGYGNDALQYPFFQQSTSNSFRRLILRNSGNDETTTLFRDAFMQDLVKHMKFDIQLSEPTIVFLNGEYNGVYNIREFQNRHYIERKYGVTPQELDLLSNGLPSDGDRQAFVAMINFLHNNPLTDTANVTELNTRIDIANFIDYVIAQIYIRNTDWPGNNVKCWRKRTTYTPNAPEGHDGRFRWLAFDTDFGFGLDGGATSFEHNSLSHAQAFGNVGIILNYLFFNDSLIHYFAHRYADMLNTTFQPDFVIHLIDSMADIYRPEIQENIDRWDSHPDLPNWEWMVEIMRIFARNRPEFAREHLRQEFQLSPERELTLALSEPDAGYMHCNTIIVRPETRGVSGNPFPWVGHYYDSIPIPLKAVANPGYVFSHWTVGNDTIYRPDINLVLNSDTLATAHFHRDTLIECTTTSIWELAECPYGFHYWSANSFPGSAPPASRFVFFNEEDPTPTATILGNVAGRYDLDSRTRINGLGERGISFVNTGNLESNPGYAPTRLGGLLVTLNTENVEQAYVQWTAETVVPASRTYGVQLEYRIGTSGAFQPVLDEMGNIMRYVRDAQAGQEKIIGPVALPNNMLGQPCVQLLWRYYYTGTRISEASGARDEIRIDDIFIVADSLPNRAQRRTEIFTDPNILGPLWVDRGDTIRYTTTSTLPNGAYRWWVENGTLLGANHLQEVHVLWDHQKSTGSIGLEVASKDACTLLGYEDIFISNLQITESESNLRAALFPNPNNGRFSIYIKPEVKGAVQGRLLNSHGAVIDHLVFLASGKHSLRYNLSPGVYFVHLFQASGDFSTTLKFIVEPN